MSIAWHTTLDELMRMVPDGARAKSDYRRLLESRASMERWAEIARRGLSEASFSRHAGVTAGRRLVLSITGLVAVLVAAYFFYSGDMLLQWKAWAFGAATWVWGFCNGRQP